MVMTSADLLRSLLERCVEDGVFARDTRVDPTDDLVESGLVDSMGLLMLAAVIEKTYEVTIPEAVFVAELRTLARIAAYLERELLAGRGRYAHAPAATKGGGCAAA
jgi:acyl carrier protein